MFYTNVEKYGKTIFHRGYDDNGNQFFKKIEYEPTLFIPSKNDDSDYKALDGTLLEPIIVGDMKETDNFIKKYADVSNFKFYGQENHTYNFIANTYKGEIVSDRNHIRTGFVDIETENELGGFPNVEEANEEILIINLFFRGKYYFFCTEKWGKFVPNDPNIELRSYPQETEMLTEFVKFWQDINLDIISGWYSEGFDIPYVINRIKRVLGAMYVRKLSPWGIVTNREVFIKGKKQNLYTIFGINHLDYQQLDIKFSGKVRENKKLDTIAFEELKINKLDYSEFSSLKELYRGDWQKYCEYNMRDVEILPKLEDKLMLIDLVIEIAHYSGTNMLDAFKNTRVWDQLIYRHLLDKNIIVPKKKAFGNSSDEQIAGGYVKETTPGVYKWIVSFDLNSLYPSLIRQYNISPETFVGIEDINIDLLVDGVDHQIKHLKNAGYAVCANGAYFSKENLGFLPELMQLLYDKRSANKKLMIQAKIAAEKILDKNSPERKKHEKQAAIMHIKQNTQKTILNSGYGAIANAGFRFFMNELAEGITLSGQLSVKWAAKRLNEYLNKLGKTSNYDYVTAIDTDSIHISFEKLLDNTKLSRDEIVAKLDALSEKVIQPKINEIFLELFGFMNAYDNQMVMKRETIAESGIYLAKKKYAYLANDIEGVAYNPPILKVTGIEIVRSSTPLFCREKLKDAVRLILQQEKEPLRKYVEVVKNEFKKLPFESVAFPRGVSDVTKYKSSSSIYTKGTPIQVRGSLMYNHLLKQHKLTSKYEEIYDGDKIRFCYMKLPNPTFENILSVPDRLPKEFNLEKYIDYDEQFDKTFMSPLKLMITAAGWETLEKQASFGDLI